MPLVKKQICQATTQSVSLNSDLEDQKKDGASFALNGLNDESIDGATTIPSTTKENAKLTSDTTKLDKKAETVYSQQVSKHVETYGLMPPVVEECLDGSLDGITLSAI